MSKSAVEMYDFGVDASKVTPHELAKQGLNVKGGTSGATQSAPPKVSVKDVLSEQDKTAKQAIMNEAKQATGVIFTFDGETYNIPKVDDWDIEIFEAQESNKLTTTVRLLLGDDQYEKFKTQPDPNNEGKRIKKKRTATDLDELLSAGMKAMGVTKGE